jgi:hypothetical protein
MAIEPSDKRGDGQLSEAEFYALLDVEPDERRRLARLRQDAALTRILAKALAWARP